MFQVIGWMVVGLFSLVLLCCAVAPLFLHKYRGIETSLDDADDVDDMQDRDQTLENILEGDGN